MIGTNETSEGSYIGWLDHGCDDDSDLSFEERISIFREQAKKHYDAAVQAKVGTTIVCPTCGVSHVKTTYHKKFCGKKQRGQSNCRDIYHNVMTDSRLFMTQLNMKQR